MRLLRVHDKVLAHAVARGRVRDGTPSLAEDAVRPALPRELNNVLNGDKQSDIASQTGTGALAALRSSRRL